MAKLTNLGPPTLRIIGILEEWNDGAKQKTIQYTLLNSQTHDSSIPLFQHSMSRALGKHFSMISQLRQNKGMAQCRTRICGCG